MFWKQCSIHFFRILLTSYFATTFSNKVKQKENALTDCYTPEMINWPEIMFFFFQCQIDFIGYIPNIYIPATSFLFIQSRVLKGRLNFTRLNIIQTQNDASISRASCALSFIYEVFSFFCPPFPFLIQQSIWKWRLAVGVCTHGRACISLRAAFVCRASRLNGSISPAWLRWLQWGRAETTFPSCVPFNFSKAAPTIIVPG